MVKHLKHDDSLYERWVGEDAWGGGGVGNGRMIIMTFPRSTIVVAITINSSNS